MSRFPSEFSDLPMMHPPLGSSDDSLQDWNVQEDWISPPLHGKRVAIRKGFLTDGASIPRAVWGIVGHPFSKPLLGPALCHDALYMGELLGHDIAAKTLSDWWFLEWMKKAGMNWNQRNTVWLGPRMFGKSVWRAHTRDSIAHARCFCALVNEDMPLASIVWPAVPLEVAVAAMRRRNIRKLGLASRIGGIEESQART
jgi:hypothetical protein